MKLTAINGKMTKINGKCFMKLTEAPPCYLRSAKNTLNQRWIRFMAGVGEFRLNSHNRQVVKKL